MKKINGFQNEYEIVKYLNNKKIKFLDPMFKELLTKLYGNLNENLIIKSNRIYDNKKYDIVININNVIKRISIKMGSRNSVHVEGISSFINFLIESKVDRKVVIEYLKYHYADGTTNGSGKLRLSCKEYKNNNQDKIDYINNAINNDFILNRVIDRFILQGRNSKEKIDAIIYGTKEDFLYLTKDEIIEVILSKKNFYSTGIHFGPLFCQPLDRCLNYNEKYKSKRFCIQIKWYSIFDDIIEYMNKINER